MKYICKFRTSHTVPGDIQGILHSSFQLLTRHEVNLLLYKMDEWIDRVTCAISFRTGEEVRKMIPNEIPVYYQYNHLLIFINSDV